MGDAACHMSSICLTCGRYFDEAGEIEGPCLHCGARGDVQSMSAQALLTDGREIRDDSVRQKEGPCAF